MPIIQLNYIRRPIIAE